MKKILSKLHDIYVFLYSYSLYFEESKDMPKADSFFEKGKITEEVIEELENKNTETKYLVYPVWYLYDESYPEYNNSFLFNTEKEAKEFLNYANENYNTTEITENGYEWKMLEIKADNSKERLHKMAKDKRMIKEDVILRDEYDDIVFFFDTQFADYEYDYDYEGSFLDYIKEELKKGYYIEDANTEYYKKYDLLRIAEDVEKNEGKMIEIENLKKYRI
jgi:hypothetical protein